MKKLRTFFLFGLALLLSGCKFALLDPKGVIAASEKTLLIDATLLMLIIVVPVILMSFVFAWRFRASNTKAKYEPDWSHNTVMEATWFAIPCVIIGILAVITWITSHTLDPYRPIASNKPPIVIEAISLDWKWLFIYPNENIATVNFVEIPKDVPVVFKITADAPMNSLEIPQLAGQIYAMPGMRTKLNIMATENGKYDGFSANFSGDGFSDMNFVVQVASEEDYQAWVKNVQKSPKELTEAEYADLAKPGVNHDPIYYSKPAAHLFHTVLMKYMGPDMPMKQ